MTLKLQWLWTLNCTGRKIAVMSKKRNGAVIGSQEGLGQSFPMTKEVKEHDKAKPEVFSKHCFGFDLSL